MKPRTDNVANMKMEYLFKAIRFGWLARYQQSMYNVTLFPSGFRKRSRKIWRFGSTMAEENDKSIMVYMFFHRSPYLYIIKKLHNA